MDVDTSYIEEDWEEKITVDDELKQRIWYAIKFQTPTKNEGTWKTRQSGLFITTNDEVYGLGYNNKDNLLVLTGTDSSSNIFMDKPRKINELSGKKIREICIAERFAIAMTWDGKILHWGISVGNDQQVELPHEPKSKTMFLNFACGAQSVTLITADYQVLFWGCVNPDYCFNEESIKLKVRKGVKIKALASGRCHTALLDQNGVVWTFGHGSRGQLGYAWSFSEQGETAINKVKLPGKCVKVCCGAYSTLFLLQNGDVYASGGNVESDHLGVGHSEPVKESQKVLLTGKISDIAAAYKHAGPSSWQTIFGAYSIEDGSYYRWGEVASSSGPEQVDNESSFLRLFSKYNTPASLGFLQSPPYAVAAKLENILKVPKDHLLYEMSIIGNWAIMKRFDVILASKMTSFMIYGAFERVDVDPIGAFIITNEDEVYAVGTNISYGYLGLEDGEPVRYLDNPLLFEQLSHKKIKRILVNHLNGFALADDASLYVWDRKLPPCLLQNNVKNMAVGFKFIVYQLGNSEIYFHGCFPLGAPCVKNRLLQVPPEESIVSISAGMSHCAFLSNKSNVYTCGEGYSNQLAYNWDPNDDVYILRPVHLPDKCVKVECGCHSTFFMTQQGDLYACGANRNRDNLFVGHSRVVMFPEKVHTPESIVDFAIALSVMEFGSKVSIIAIKTVSGKIYKWGGSIEEPTLVNVSRLVEAFEDMEIPQSLSMVQVKRNVVHNTVDYSLFDDSLFSDVTLKLQDSRISAHKAVLYSYSPFFRTMLAGESSGREMDLSKHGDAAVKVFTKFFYNPESIKDARWTNPAELNLYDLAKSNGDSKLIDLSKSLVSKSIVYEMVSSLLSKTSLEVASRLMKTLQKAND